MKKNLALVLALALVLLMAVGCGGNSGSAPALKTGLGMKASMSGGNATADKAGNTQADVTVCTVSLDAGGKIASVSWDVMQCKAAVSATGEVTITEAIRSKKELKEDYKMKGASKIGKEWYEQVAALEAYAVGKTPAEVTGMKVTEVNNHTNVPDIEDLRSSCTISCGDFFETLTKAAADAK